MSGSMAVPEDAVIPETSRVLGVRELTGQRERRRKTTAVNTHT